MPPSVETRTATSPRYYSTRDAQKTRVSFEQALLTGLAPDGGLFVPDHVPAVARNAWQKAPTLAVLGERVLEPWLNQEIPTETLSDILQDALDFDVPLVPLGDDVYVLELFHGPTLSFKDVGARTMARLTNHFLAKRGERVTILVATSGDTGSAVADGFAGLGNIDVVLLYPKGMVSDVQERQLIVKRPNVRAFAVEGNFDDCQRLVKQAFVDKALDHVPLSSANSINIGRLLPQSLYYLWAATQLARQGASGGGELVFCIPSGNLGNLTGGVLAQRMGLPVTRFLAAHNANDFFPQYLLKALDAYAFKPTVATVSNAMDVGSPSNFERLHALLTEDDLTRIKGWSIPDDVTRQRMRLEYEHSGYVACPHTAVGIEAVRRYREETGDTLPVVTLATAHPAKFPRTVSQTLGIPEPRDDKLEVLWQRDTLVQPLPARLEALRETLLEPLR
jgi:threonine synthase